jgi:hypothetical protein
LAGSFVNSAGRASVCPLYSIPGRPGWLARQKTGRHVDGNAGEQYDYRHARVPSRRGAATASIIVGAAAQGALAATKTGMNIETSDGRMSTSTIDGLSVTRTFNFKDKSGTILVALSTNAMFSLSFNGIAEDEALALVKKFNWKAMQAAQPK